MNKNIYSPQVRNAKYEIEQIKKYVEYLETEVELNLPTQLFESASNAIKEHAKNLQDISNDAMYLQEHGYCTRICMGGQGAGAPISQKGIIMKLEKIFDCRTMGQVFDGEPLVVWVECSKDDGAEYKGWYMLSSDWAKYYPKQYYFHQSKLSGGKVCQRKVSAKISKTLINIIKCNIDQVVDYAELYKQATKGA